MTEVNSSVSRSGKSGATTHRRVAGDTIATERRSEIERVGENSFRVPSRSRVGRVHTVDVEKNGCTCEDRQINKRICAHLWAAAAVMMGLESEPEYVIERGHDSRLGGLYGGRVYRLIEYRAGKRVGVVGERGSWYECHLDRIDLGRAA